MPAESEGEAGGGSRREERGEAETLLGWRTVSSTRTQLLLENSAPCPTKKKNKTPQHDANNKNGPSIPTLSRQERPADTFFLFSSPFPKWSRPDRLAQITAASHVVEKSTERGATPPTQCGNQNPGFMEALSGTGGDAVDTVQPPRAHSHHPHASHLPTRGVLEKAMQPGGQERKSRKKKK